MNDKNNDNISGIFNINENDIPSSLIKKTDNKIIKEPILSSNEAIKTLPKEAQKQIKEEKKYERKKVLKKKTKKSFSFFCIIFAAICLLIGIVSIISSHSDIPEIRYEKPVEGTIFTEINNIGLCVSDNFSFNVFFVDNEYDTNFIEKGQKVEMVTSKNEKFYGKIFEIKEEAPTNAIIQKYYNILAQPLPSTPVYTVSVLPDNTEVFPENGSPVSVKVFTDYVENAISVPASAIQTIDNKNYVWIYSGFNHSLKKTEVKTGIITKDRAQIISKIKKSAKVAYEFSCDTQMLTDGIKVKIKK